MIKVYYTKVSKLQRSEELFVSHSIIFPFQHLQFIRSFRPFHSFFLSAYAFLEPWTYTLPLPKKLTKKKKKRKEKKGGFPLSSKQVVLPKKGHHIIMSTMAMVMYLVRQILLPSNADGRTQPSCHRILHMHMHKWMDCSTTRPFDR